MSMFVKAAGGNLLPDATLAAYSNTVEDVEAARRLAVRWCGDDPVPLLALGLLADDTPVPTRDSSGRIVYERRRPPATDERRARKRAAEQIRRAAMTPEQREAANARRRERAARRRDAS